MERVWLQVMKASHREFQRLKGAVSRDPELSLPGLTQYQNQAAGLAGHLVADVMLFPLGKKWKNKLGQLIKSKVYFFI